MSQKAGRIVALAAALAAIGAMSIATAAASAFTIGPSKLPPSRVTGFIEIKKLKQKIPLPVETSGPNAGEGVGTFNGEDTVNVNLSNFFIESGTLSNLDVTEAPFNASVNILGIPTTIGVTFTQLTKPSETTGTITEDPTGCTPTGARSTGPPPNYIGTTASGCVTLNIPTKAALGITGVDIDGIKLATKCTTDVTLPLSASLTKDELQFVGAFFTGTTNLPLVKCSGPLGFFLGQDLSLLMSGPGNAFELNVLDEHTTFSGGTGGM
jgi:hypothetical protein